MKKLLALLLTLTMVAALAACGAKPAEPAAPAEGDAAPAKVYKVAMICDSSISDGGWGAACYSAMVAAAETKGWETAYTDSIDVAAYVDTLSSYAQMDYDMIFAPGNQYTDAVKQVAKDYPDVCFSLLNGTKNDVSDNIMAILPDADQIGYMAGALAGLMTQTNVLGFIGAIEIDTTKAKLAGYEAAAKVVNPDITVKSAYAGGFSDTAKGMELAKGMIGEKADVFFGDASAVDSGARQAVDAANGTGEIKIFDIGQPSDLLTQNPCVISSVVTDNAGMIGLCMDAVVAGAFGNDVIYGSLENNCLAVGKFNDELVSPEIQKEYLGYVEQMKAGTFLAK